MSHPVLQCWFHESHIADLKLCQLKRGEGRRCGNNILTAMAWSAVNQIRRGRINCHTCGPLTRHSFKTSDEARQGLGQSCCLGTWPDTRGFGEDRDEPPRKRARAASEESELDEGSIPPAKWQRMSVPEVLHGFNDKMLMTSLALITFELVRRHEKTQQEHRSVF